MANIRDLLTILEGFEKEPESVGHDLRLDLAEIVLATLDKRGWTQKRLAEAAGMKESFVTRIIHGASNCTFDVAGRLLYALGMRAHLTTAPCYQIEAPMGAPGQDVEYAEMLYDTKKETFHEIAASTSIGPGLTAGQGRRTEQRTAAVCQ